MNTYEQKAILRVEMSQKRKALEEPFIFAANLRGELLASILIDRWRPHKIGLYWSKDNEYPTRSCIEKFRKNDIKVYLPVVVGDDLSFYCFEGEEHLVTGHFGVQVPSVKEENKIDPIDIDIIVAPGVAYDRHLRRMGYGKGYYDRFLPKLRPSAIKIGLAYNFQILDQIPFTKDDQPVDYLFTESWTTL